MAIGRSLLGVSPVVRQVGSVAELHALDPFAGGPPEGPVVWWCDPIDSAIVLGSRQTPDLLDADACARDGLSIVRRRSGGGAVLIRRAEMVWLDLVLPHGVAPDDVRGSMVWAGERWLEALGRPDGVEVHDGGMVCNAWSGLVCFAGIGPGEVVVGDRKLVGLSQRRTRHGLRVQGMVHLAEPDPSGLFATDLPEQPLVPPIADAALDAPAVADRLAVAITAAA